MANASSKRTASDGSSSSGGLDPYHHHQHAPAEKRPRTRFFSAVVKAWEHNQREKLLSAMEPVLRKVVSEEVERRLIEATTANSPYLRRSPSFRVRALEPPPVNIPLHLVFPKTLKQHIFTKNKIVFEDNSPVQVLLVGLSASGAVSLVDLPFPIKLEIVVLNGDFPPLRHDDDGVWPPEEFEGRIVRARKGKPPLLTGDLVATLRPDGGCGELMVAASFGELQLTDNSKCTPSRNFRLGVRVIPGSYGGGIRIREAVSNPFRVRECRGEYYQKHYPPKLEDEVWRLEKIGRGGPVHKKLASEGIVTVQDFLKMNIVEPELLRSFTGGSKKNLETSLQHAMTCDRGSKRYLFQVAGDSLVLDPICGVVQADINGQIYTAMDSISPPLKSYIDNLVKVAHLNWGELRELNEAPAAIF